MGWNYRICRKANRLKDGTLYSYEPYFTGLYEVYYNFKGEICGVTEEPVRLISEDFRSLHSLMNLVLKAFEKPEIDLETLQYAEWCSDPEYEEYTRLIDEYESPDLTDERRKEIDQRLQEMIHEDEIDDILVGLQNINDAEHQELLYKLIGRPNDETNT